MSVVDVVNNGNEIEEIKYFFFNNWLTDSFDIIIRDINEL